MANGTMNWDEYERGRFSPRQGSVGSTTSHIHFDEPWGTPGAERLNIPGRDHDSSDHDLRRVRSSLSMRINSITQVGGVNSIANFASSWQRAVGFHEITPVRASFILAGDDDLAGDRRAHDDTVTQATRHGQERGDLPVTGGYPYHTHHKSLLRQQLLAEGTSPESLVVEGSAEGGPSHTAWENTVLISSPSREQGDIFRHASHLATPYGSYSSTYGSLSAPLNQSSKSHAAQLYQEQQLHGTQEPGKEQEPLLMKRVEEDGKVILTVIGQSTLYQTVLNSTNVLIGVGLLTLPLGIKYAGWVVGLAFLTFSAIITKYTARQLGKCLDLDRSLITFADLAYISFGSGAQISIGILFTLELTAACVALFVLFGDSLDLLFPGWGVTEFKILLGIIMIPLSFVPLRLLGYTSSLGITCCLGVVILIFIDGFIKPHAPGSLREPAQTYLFPLHWSTLPLSFGLLMSPWGGHSVFPNIYRDMRHPKKYDKNLNYTFGFTFVLDISMAVGGLLMFGEETRDELSSNILLTPGYPKIVSMLMVICIAIIPVTKLPLNARPIFGVIEHFLGLGPREIPETPGLVGMSGLGRGLLKCAVRIVVVITMTIIAVLCPSFDRVMALMGSTFCFTICIILPLAFYLKLFGKEISLRERIFDWFLIVICSVMAIVGTVWAFLPQEITKGR